MNVKFKRFLSSVMAMVMLMATFTIGNGSAVFADDDLGEMAISDLNIEETPADTATDTSATDDEPLFVNLGDVTANEAMINLAADTTTTKTGGTWTVGTSDAISGTDYTDIATVGSYTIKGAANSKNNTVTNASVSSQFTGTSYTNALFGNKMALRVTGLTKDDKISVVCFSGNSSLNKTGECTITVGTESLTTKKDLTLDKDQIKTIEYTATDSSDVDISGTSRWGVLAVTITPASSGGTESSYAAVSISESPAEGGTFKLTGGNGGATLNDTTPSATASEESFAVSGNYTLTVNPDDGYEVSSVTASGATVTGSDGTYTIEISDATVEIFITYKETETTTVTTTETTTVTTTETTPETTTSAVSENYKVELNASDLDVNTAVGNGTALGDYFKVVTGRDTIAVAELSSSTKITTSDGTKTITKEIQLSSGSNSKRAISFTTTSAGKVEFYVKNEGGGDRTFTLEGSKKATGTLSKGEVKTLSFDVEANQTYYFYADNDKAKVYYIASTAELQQNSSDVTTTTTKETTTEATTKETTTETTTVAQTGILTIKSTNAPAGAGYTIKDSTGKTLTATSTDTYTLTDGATYDLDVNGIQHYSNEVKYNGQDISDTGVFTYSKDVTELTITYTEDSKCAVTINVTSDNDDFNYKNAIPLVDGTALTASNSATVTYTYNDYKGTTHTITAPDVSGYTKTITSNGSEISSFTVAEGLIINIEYNKVVVSANDSWNFNNLDSITANSENTLTGSNGTELIYKAGKSDKISGSTSNSYTTGIGTQNGKGIAPNGGGSISSRCYTLEIEPNATFTMYYVRNSKDAAASIANSSDVLATGNTVTTATDLGTVSYTNTTSNTMTIYCYGDSNKPIFIGATLSGTITSFANIVVKVVDEDNNAVTDATVKVGNATISKSDTGEYTFTGPFTTAVKATVSKTGYVTTETEAFTKAETKTVTLKKVTAITVSGTVTDKETGTSLSSATVTLTFTDGTSKSVTTSTNGEFSFTGVSNLKSITISHNGYVTYTKSFTGSETTNQTVNAALTKTSNTVSVKLYTDDTTKASAAVFFGTTSSSMSSKIFDSKKTYETSATLTNINPGDSIYFKSGANNITAWQPVIIDGSGNATVQDKSQIVFYPDGKYFVYTVPETVDTSCTYGVKFTISSDVGHTDTHTATESISYGKYGFGLSKVRVNAGHDYDIITQEQAVAGAAYGKYNARNNLTYTLKTPAIGNFGAYYNDKYNNIDTGTGEKPYIDNQYGLLDSNSSISFNVNVGNDIDTVDITIDKSGGSVTATYTNSSGTETSLTIGDNKANATITVKNGTTVTLKNTNTSKVASIKTVRLYNPNNVFGNLVEGPTPMSTDHNNVLVQKIGTVANLKNQTLFKSLTTSGISDDDTVFRIVTRIVVPDSIDRNNINEVYEYVHDIDEIGYDVYTYDTYTNLDKNTSTGNHYNKEQSLNAGVSHPTETDKNIDSIVFSDAVNTAVAKVTVGSDGIVTADSGVNNDNPEFGAINSTNYYDLYVQTFIATNKNLTLIPYTKVDGSLSYTVTSTSQNNVAVNVMVDNN